MPEQDHLGENLEKVSSDWLAKVPVNPNPPGVRNWTCIVCRTPIPYVPCRPDSVFCPECWEPKVPDAGH